MFAESCWPWESSQTTFRTGNQWRVRLQAAHTESITGTSTSTPTTVATASSKKLLAPMSATGDRRKLLF
jgi:hypothetical protein